MSKLKKKKKMTVRLEFTVKATIPAVRSPILAIQW